MAIQLLILTHYLDASTARQLATRGSLSGALLSAQAIQVQGLTLSGPSAEWLMRVTAAGVYPHDVEAALHYISSDGYSTKETLDES